MRLLVYTAVFGDYDRVYAPVVQDPRIDYVIVTENAATKAPGWRTHVVDASRFASPKAANLYHRALIHRELPGYAASLYIDGNIRLLSRTSEVLTPFLETGAALCVFRHPLRNTVADEVAALIETNKVSDPEPLRRELDDYVADGFPDDRGLVETTIIAKNHSAPDLDPAMELWWTLFNRYRIRDQVSLPVVKWKTGVSYQYFPGSFRDPNPHFALYPHYAAAGVRPFYAHTSARSHDSLAYKLLLETWHASWRLRRAFRRAPTGSPA